MESIRKRGKGRDELVYTMLQPHHTQFLKIKTGLKKEMFQWTKESQAAVLVYSMNVKDSR